MRRWWGASGPAGSFSKRGLDGFTGRTKPIFSPRECTSHFGFSLVLSHVWNPGVQRPPQGRLDNHSGVTLFQGYGDFTVD